MGLFSRSNAGRVPSNEEIDAAGRALAQGNCEPADQLVKESGKHERTTAMRVLGASTDYTQQD